MTTAQRLYREILDGNFGRDVEYIANVILVAEVKPTTRLRNLLSRIRLGQDIRNGDRWGMVRINGAPMTLATAFNSVTYNEHNYQMAPDYRA